MFLSQLTKAFVSCKRILSQNNIFKNSSIFVDTFLLLLCPVVGLFIFFLIGVKFCPWFSSLLPVVTCLGRWQGGYLHCMRKYFLTPQLGKEEDKCELSMRKREWTACQTVTPIHFCQAWRGGGGSCALFPSWFYHLDTFIFSLKFTLKACTCSSILTIPNFT